MNAVSGYDVIGDVHGEYDALVRLLSSMGYRRTDGAWRCNGRQAAFVGDLIDRGSEQVKVVTLVREMHDAGTAQVVMGNHEWNALEWATERPGDHRRFLRDHEDSNKRKQHEAFLHQVGDGSPRHHEYLRWFATLPMCLELDGLRVVHACWQQSHIDHLRKRTNGTCRVTHDLLVGAHTKNSVDHKAIEAVLKGIEVRLPDGKSFLDKGKHVRHDARIKWWDSEARSYQEAALIDDEEVRNSLPTDEIPAGTVEPLDENGPPVIFGHYWFPADKEPVIQTPKAVCVDYSVGKEYGRLAAYRWSGEIELDTKNLIAVPRNS